MLNVGRSLEHPTHVPNVTFHVVILIAARESCTGKENVHYIQTIFQLGGFVTIMGQDGKPIQISASDLQSGATLKGIFIQIHISKELESFQELSKS